MVVLLQELPLRLLLLVVVPPLGKLLVLALALLVRQVSSTLELLRFALRRRALRTLPTDALQLAHLPN